MKIRIKGNSVRYRLTKTEVDSFCNIGRVAEYTHFPMGKFTYVLQAEEGLEKLEATFGAGTITLFLPESKSRDWAVTDKVGFSNTLSLENGQELYLLVEKDFVCLDETVEDQSDNYPNPQAGNK